MYLGICGLPRVMTARETLKSPRIHSQLKPPQNDPKDMIRLVPDWYIFVHTSNTPGMPYLDMDVVILSRQMSRSSTGIIASRRFDSFPRNSIVPSKHLFRAILQSSCGHNLIYAHLNTRMALCGVVVGDGSLHTLHFGHDG